MQIKSFAGAAVLLASAQTVMSLGTARIVNQCSFPVYYNSVSGGSAPPKTVLPAGGYSQTYVPNNSGVSIKLGTSSGASDVTQFEFTCNGNGKVSYDISNIDGHPFANHGVSIVPSMTGDGSNPTCQALNCPAGQQPCSQAYNAPNDPMTMVCNSASDLTMYLCTGGSSSAASSSESNATASKREESHHAHRIHARHILKK